MRRRQMWAPRVARCSRSSHTGRCCGVPGGPCRRAFPDVEISTREKLLSVCMSGVGSKGLWLKRNKYACTSSGHQSECVSCRRLHCTKGCAALEHPSLFLLLRTETRWFRSTHTCKGCGGPDSHPEREMRYV